jgi:hypothetical protein
MTLAIVVAAAADLSMAVAADWQRTRTTATDAQLRQLLLAGCQAARQRLADGDVAGQGFAVQLPTDLAADGAVLTVAPASTNGSSDATITVNARYSGHRSSEQLRFHHGDAGWVLVDVAINS